MSENKSPYGIIWEAKGGYRDFTEYLKYSQDNPDRLRENIQSWMSEYASQECAERDRRIAELEDELQSAKNDLHGYRDMYFNKLE